MSRAHALNVFRSATASISARTFATRPAHALTTHRRALALGARAYSDSASQKSSDASQDASSSSSNASEAENGKSDGKQDNTSAELEAKLKAKEAEVVDVTVRLV
jgi:hypothetical protein